MILEGGCPVCRTLMVVDIVPTGTDVSIGIYVVSPLRILPLKLLPTATMVGGCIDDGAVAFCDVSFSLPVV